MRKIVAGIVIGAIAIPAFASADVISDLLAQLKILQAQLQALQAQNQSAPAQSICVELARDLSTDDTDEETGGQVGKLQQFLINAGVYPEARITGYFGPATMRAVQRWQAQKGIVSSGDADSTGYGYVGRRTRAAMAQGCETTTAPTSYSAPFLVTYATETALSRYRANKPSSGSCGNGYDFYDGGADTDTLTYSGHRADFYITKHADGSYTFRDQISCRADVDTVINFEQFQFADGLYTLENLRPDAVESRSLNTSFETATIDPDKLTQVVTGSFTVTGSASNTNNVTIFLVPANYPTYDYAVAAGQIGKDGYYRSESVVSGGRWSALFSSSAPSAYFIVLVFDSATKKLLTSNALTVSQPASIATPVISSLSANPSQIALGQSTTLSWNANNANRCVLQYDKSEETVATNGTKVVVPQESTYYRLWCVNDPGTGKDGPSAEKVVTAYVMGLPTCTLLSNKSSYALGETVTLSWTSMNTTYAAFQNNTDGKETLSLPGDKLSTSGTQTVTASVIGNPLIIMRAYNAAGGSGTCTSSFNVHY